MEDELKRDAAVLHEMWFNDWSRKIGYGAVLVFAAFALSLFAELYEFTEYAATMSSKRSP